MSLFVLSQALVGLAFCSDIISFQMKERVHIISCLIVSCILVSLHFVCLDHWTAASLALLAAIRFVCSLLSTSKWVMASFMAASVVAAAFTYEGMLSLLSCSGTLFGTAASFSKDDRRLRKLMFIGTSLWLVHNIIAGSPGAVLLEIFFLGSNLVGYFRYYIRPARRALS